MEVNIKTLPKSPEELEKIIFCLHQSLQESKSELTLYKEKYVRLLEEIRLAKQHRFGSSSEKNSDQPDLFDEAGLPLSDEVKEQLNDEVEVKGYTRKKHPIRRPLPHDIPRETIIHDIPDAEKICACGSALVRIGEEITEQLKYIPAQLSVIQHVRPKYACKPCQENIKIAPMPLLLLPKCIATPELVAHTIIAKYCDHIPLYRQEGIWSRLDIDLPRSSLCGWILKTAELCQPLVQVLQEDIIAYDYAQADETTVQVLDEVGRSHTTKSYMWVYQGGLQQRSIVFDYQETRSGQHAKLFLSGFNGYLQTDAYTGYNWTDQEKKITSLGCMAHARRPFANLAKLTKTPGIANEAVKFFKKLYAIEQQARENNLSPDARYQLRQTKAPPILNAFKQWLDFHIPKTSEQSQIGKAIRYGVTHWTELTNYLLDGRLDIDNNRIENTIRPFALGRKTGCLQEVPVALKQVLFFIL